MKEGPLSDESKELMLKVLNASPLSWEKLKIVQKLQNLLDSDNPTISMEDAEATHCLELLKRSCSADQGMPVKPNGMGVDQVLELRGFLEQETKSESD